MTRACGLILALLVLLQGCAGPRETVATDDGPAPGVEEATSEVDWWIYRRRRSPNTGSGRLLPLYSYNWDERASSKDFTVWPLLTGYQRGENRLYFFSAPLLTVLGHAGTEARGSEFFSSLPLGTVYSEDRRPDLTREELVSLPLLLWTRTLTYTGSRGTLERRSFFTPLGATERLTLTPKADGARPLVLSRRQLLGLTLGGEDRVSIVDLEAWDDDEQTALVNIFNLSLYRTARFRGRYPGARFAGKEDENPRDLVESRSRPPEALPEVSELELGPLFRMRSEETRSRWEALSLIGYRRDGDRTRVALLPLMLEFDGWRPSIEPSTLTRLWPLLYHDVDRRRWDVLWPLVYYRDDEFEDLTELRIRLLFRYRQKSDRVAVRLLSGLLYDHVDDDRRASTSLLMGFLYESRSQVADQSSEWRLLKGLLFGKKERQGEHPTYTVLFVRFGGGPDLAAKPGSD